MYDQKIANYDVAMEGQKIRSRYVSSDLGSRCPRICTRADDDGVHV